ncbi:M48 family metallopeptidase, partial [Shigella flexneri]
MSASLAFTLLFAVALSAGLLLRFWLAARQIRHVARHRDAVPAPFAGTVDLAAHRKAADYTVARMRFGLIEAAWGAATLIAWTLLGGLDLL